MSSGRQLQSDILATISAHDGPMPTRQLVHHCVQTLRHPQAEVYGMLGDMIGRDLIRSRPDATHGAVYEVIQWSDQWIACSERMPELGVRVLLYARGVREPHQLGTYEGEQFDRPWNLQWITLRHYEVTHWQPVPAPPEPKP